MDRRFDTLVFPGGKTRAFTLSYDDGVNQDRRLVALFNRYQLKCTFNLNSGFFSKEQKTEKVDFSKVSKEEAKTLYEGHEIAGHSLVHSLLTGIKTPRMTYEIVEDKRQLEELSGNILRMFAYPFGVFNEDVKTALKLSGYLGARTVKPTFGFDLPTDPFEWNPTCHHDDEQVFDLLDKFFNEPPLNPRLFYLWGHAYEFDCNENWDRIEKICALVDEHRKDIWICTNGEILEYMKAYQSLEYSVDGSRIFNPSILDVTILTDFNKTATIPAGQTVIINS